jgi:hypothetical protein
LVFAESCLLQLQLGGFAGNEKGLVLDSLLDGPFEGRGLKDFLLDFRLF